MDLDAFRLQLAKRHRELDDHPLHRAARENDLDVARGLLDAGEAVDVRLSRHVGAGPFFSDLTPLMQAAFCRTGGTEFMEFLLTRGADVGAVSEMGASALYYAAGSGQIARVQLLLTRGALANERTPNGVSVLMAACGFGWFPLESTTSPDQLGWWQSPCVRIARLLIERGADVHARGPTGMTALHVAAESGNVGCVTALLESGVEVNANGDHPPPLMSAKGRDCAAALLAAGADPHATAPLGMTVPRALVARGEDAIIALLESDFEVDEALLSSLAVEAAQKGNTAGLRVLLEAGADPKVHKFGRGLLQLLASNDVELDSMEALIDFDYSIEARYHPLHIAVQGANPVMVLELLLRGEGKASSFGRSDALSLAKRELKHALDGRGPLQSWEESNATLVEPFYSAELQAGSRSSLNCRLLEEYMCCLSAKEERALGEDIEAETVGGVEAPAKVARELAEVYCSGALRWQRRKLVDVIEARLRGVDPELVMRLPDLSRVDALEAIVSLLAEGR